MEQATIRQLLLQLKKQDLLQHPIAADSDPSDQEASDTSTMEQDQPQQPPEGDQEQASDVETMMQLPVGK